MKIIFYIFSARRLWHAAAAVAPAPPAARVFPLRNPTLPLPDFLPTPRQRADETLQEEAATEVPLEIAPPTLQVITLELAPVVVFLVTYQK